MIRNPLLSNKDLRLRLSSAYVSPKGIPRDLFKLGERFTGTLLEVEQDGRVIVSGKGLTFRAHTNKPLAKGHVYEFVVARTRPKVELKIVSKAQAGQASVFGLWAGMKMKRVQFLRLLNEICLLTKNFETLPKGVVSSLQELVQWMEISPTDLVGTEGPVWIEKFLKHSGMFFEGKLKRLVQMGIAPEKHELSTMDLKGLLLKIIKALERSDTEDRQHEVVAKRVVQMLHFIEAHQILNLHTMKAGIGWFWFIPFFQDGSHCAAELLTRRSKHTYVTLLNISLSMLGHVQARLELTGNSVSVLIYLESIKISQFVGKHGQFLKERMALQGLNLASLVCIESKQDVMAMSLACAGKDSGFHMKV